MTSTTAALVTFAAIFVTLFFYYFVSFVVWTSNQINYLQEQTDEIRSALLGEREYRELRESKE